MVANFPGLSELNRSDKRSKSFGYSSSGSLSSSQQSIANFAKSDPDLPVTGPISIQERNRSESAKKRYAICPHCVDSGVVRPCWPNATVNVHSWNTHNCEYIRKSGRPRKRIIPYRTVPPPTIPRGGGGGGNLNTIQDVHDTNSVNETASIIDDDGDDDSRFRITSSESSNFGIVNYNLSLKSTDPCLDGKNDSSAYDKIPITKVFVKTHRNDTNTVLNIKIPRCHPCFELVTHDSCIFQLTAYREVCFKFTIVFLLI